MTGNDEDAQVVRAKELLAKHGFRIEVGGCGCCGSPWVRLEYCGELIIGDVRGGKRTSRDGSSIYGMFADEARHD